MSGVKKNRFKDATPFAGGSMRDERCLYCKRSQPHSQGEHAVSMRDARRLGSRVGQEAAYERRAREDEEEAERARNEYDSLLLRAVNAETFDELRPVILWLLERGRP